MIIMAEQVLIQFRADKALKQDVAEIYEQLGMDLPTLPLMDHTFHIACTLQPDHAYSWASERRETATVY